MFPAISRSLQIHLALLVVCVCFFIHIPAEVRSRNAPLFLSAHTYPLQPEAILVCHDALPNLQTSKRKLESNTFDHNLLSPNLCSGIPKYKVLKFGDKLL
jgi:hypothetical protein